MLHAHIFSVLNTLGNSWCFRWSLSDPGKTFQFSTYSFLCHLWLLLSLWLIHLTLGSSGPFYTVCSATALSTTRLYTHLPFFFQAKQIGFLSQAASTRAVVSVSAQAWKQICRPMLVGEKFVKKQPIYKLHMHIVYYIYIMYNTYYIHYIYTHIFRNTYLLHSKKNSFHSMPA